MSAPTLINLPPPPSDPVTPSDMGPGTPNSTTTSLSALSTTAIKDGHQGHLPAHSHARRASNTSDASQTTLDAERADRISRLAGLERVSTVRASSNTRTGGPTSHGAQQAGPGYFDTAGLPPHIRERSTVGSASATGSTGGRTQTTWASTSTSDILSDHGGDKMSEDNLHTSQLQHGGDVTGATTDTETEMMDRDEVSSTGGFSDEGNASLVGFGEGAGSTISGPISTAALAARFAGSTGNAFNTTGGAAGGGLAAAAAGSSTRGSVGSPTLNKAAIANLQQQQGLLPQPQQSHLGPGTGTYTPMSGVSATGALYDGDIGGMVGEESGSVTPERADPRMLDGMSYDRDVIDTTSSRRLGGGGREE